MIREYDCECYDCPMAYPPILDECIEGIWCDKVGGKLYAFGTCDDAWREELPSQIESVGERDREFRRVMGQKKKQRRMRIIEHEIGGYNPAPGWIIEVPNGEYVRYPGDSNNQKSLKRQANKRVRKCNDDIPNGNSYRKLFDYWWELY